MNHYSVNSLGDCELPAVTAMFHSDKRGPIADEKNWLFLSTSGVHGSYATLEHWKKEGQVSFLIVQPRRVATFYGNVAVRSTKDARVLRRLVDTTIRAIAASQAGNRIADDPEFEQRLEEPTPVEEPCAHSWEPAMPPVPVEEQHIMRPDLVFLRCRKCGAELPLPVEMPGEREANK